jgi:predicted RecA/RadA family phage recombinase
MALTKVSGDFLQDGSITQGHLHASHGITTTHIAEGDKLFFTNARVDSRIGSLSSSDLSEGTNLYYTDARARAAISANGSLSYNSTTGVMSFTMPAQNTSNITEGTNLYYTDARVDARITAADTDSLSEGSTNLYYTDARADARIA